MVVVALAVAARDCVIADRPESRQYLLGRAVEPLAEGGEVSLLVSPATGRAKMRQYWGLVVAAVLAIQQLLAIRPRHIRAVVVVVVGAVVVVDGEAPVIREAQAIPVTQALQPTLQPIIRCQ
jgi:hypothetical protein